MATSAGAISVKVSSDNVEFDSAMPRSAALAEQSFARISRAQQAAQKDGDNFVASIQRQVDSFGLSGTALLRYQAGLKGVSDQAAPLIDRLERLQNAQAAFSAKANDGSLSNVGAAFADAANGADKAAHGSSGLTRELIVLGHEVATGNYTRLGGSLLVMARFSETARAAIAALMGPLGAVAVVLAAVGIAAYQGAEQQKKFTDSLQLTNNYAGVTRDSIQGMAESISALNKVPIGGVKDALQEIVSTGRFTGAAVASVGAATVNLAKLTGESSADIVKKFAGMSDGVAKSALELNKQYHFLTLADYEYIQALEAQGKTTEAIVATMDKLNGQLKNQTTNLGFIGTALKQDSIWASEFWQWMQKLGQTPTMGAQLGAEQQKLQVLQQQLANTNAYTGPNKGAQDAARERLTAAIAEQQQIVDNLKARTQLAQVAADAEGRIAKANEQDLLQSSAGYQDALTSLAMAGIKKRMDEAQAARDEMQIGIERSYANAELTLKGYQDAEFMIRKAALQDKLTLIAEEAKAIEARPPGTPTEVMQQEAKLLDIAAKRYAVLSAIAKLNEEHRTNATVLNPPSLVDQAPETGSQQFSRFEHSQDSQTQATIGAMAEAHSAFLEQLRQQNLAVDKEIDQLNAETASLGQSTLARQMAVAVSKLQAEADKEIAANGSDRERILQELTDRTTRLTSAMQRNYDATRSFDTGATIAFQRYQENASNSAKFAEDVIGGSLDRLTDSLAKFVETGKFSFTTLFTWMADEFIKNTIRMQVASATGSSSGWLGTILSMFGVGGMVTNTGAGGAINNTGTSLPTAGGAAGGTNFVERDMLTIIHQGEAIVPKAYNPAAGVSASGGRSAPAQIHIHNNAGAQVSTQQDDDGTLHFIIDKAAAAAENRVAGGIATGRGPVHLALKNRGLPVNNALQRRT